jgi:hypothetical protein
MFWLPEPNPNEYLKFIFSGMAPDTDNGVYYCDFNLANILYSRLSNLYLFRKVSAS